MNMTKTHHISMLISPITSFSEKELDFFINNKTYFKNLMLSEEYHKARSLHVDETLIHNKDHYYRPNTAGSETPMVELIKEAAWEAAKKATGLTHVKS